MIGGIFVILYCLETGTITLYRLLFIPLWNNKDFFNPNHKNFSMSISVLMQTLTMRGRRGPCLLLPMIITSYLFDQIWKGNLRYVQIPSQLFCFPRSFLRVKEVIDNYWGKPHETTYLFVHLVKYNNIIYRFIIIKEQMTFWNWKYSDEVF